MKLKPAFAVMICIGAALLSGAPSRAHAGEIKLLAQLVWGTNDPKSPNPKYKPVGAKLDKKLKESPFKWDHYFEVNREDFSVPQGKEKTIEMSKNCQIKVKYLGNSQIELTLIGKGKPVHKLTRDLPKGDLLIEGGNAENSTAWFVVLRQAD